MAHCGYEPTAADATLSNPLAALRVAFQGIRTTGEMAPEISLEGQRPAQYVFEGQVQKTLTQIRAEEAAEKAAKAAAKAAKKTGGAVTPMEAAE
jgi:hypothetical protein